MHRLGIILEGRLLKRRLILTYTEGPFKRSQAVCDSIIAITTGHPAILHDSGSILSRRRPHQSAKRYYR
jgi:hypothetical protein